jgi:rubrerythrin
MQALLAARLVQVERQVAELQRKTTALLRLERKHANLQRIHQSLCSVVEWGKLDDNPQFHHCSECGHYDWFFPELDKHPPECPHCRTTFED